VIKIKSFSVFPFLIAIMLLITSCGGGFKLPGGDARKNPPDPKQRVKKNLEEGKGFRVSNIGGTPQGGNFEFASSNELWRASLDVISFMPLTSANYSGGILITDWYSDGSSKDESIKIIIRFLSNEVRSDALDIKIFYRKCETIDNCKTFEKESNLNLELQKEILKKATIYKAENKEKNFKPYDNSSTPSKN